MSEEQKAEVEEEESKTADKTEQLNSEPLISDAELLARAKELEEIGKSANIAERYQQAKEKDVEKLTAQIEAKSGRNTKAQKRKWWIKTGLMLLLIGLSVAIMFTLGNYLSSEGTKSFTETVRGINLPMFGMFVLSLLLFMTFESLKYAYLLKISTGKFRFRNSVKTMFLGKYYDGITPLATGGQPFQIYYLHKKDIPAGVATAVPLVKFTVSTIVFCLTAIVMFIIAPYIVPKGTVTITLQVIAWISMAANFLVPVAIITVSLFPKAGKKAIVKIVALLNKMHIVKRRYKVTKKYVYEVGEYCTAIKVLIHHWWNLIPLVLICMCGMVTYVMIPYFVVVSVANIPATGELFLQIFCMSLISYYAASLVPTPGNSGAVETTTSLVFITVTGIDPVIGWVVLLWRFATYYVYILSGIGINIFEIIRSAVRNKRALRQNK